MLILGTASTILYLSLGVRYAYSLGVLRACSILFLFWAWPSPS